MQTDIVIPKNMEEALQMYKTAFADDGGMVLLSICDRGSFKLSINGKKSTISTGDILICPPGVIIETVATKGRSDIKYLGIRYKAFLQSIRTGRNVWSILMYAHSNPVFHLNESDRELTSSYYKVIEGKLKTQRGYYYDEIIRSLLQCVIYELCVILNREMGTKEEDNSVRSKDVIFKKFMELLAEGEGRYRSLKYYSDALYVTPKYLSAVTNEVCGISAHEMVLNNVANHIQRELEFSETSVKELSVRFGFPNLSSFGKFVKTRLGKSPRAFRKDS
ncbi:MAG: AraC family transcriptional regulator [Bacteroidales bacterium]|nr:AraC family transcriptional regulator [Bacteroidales bacterium]MBQ7467423.1 AraC family transcriptional regulator [Bacteroidales bacterium]MBQ8461426.1 AraC family transcriptional regulator [Bacteroidales bacterium]MDT3360944.1 helix-turn-helix domain-containing protein [Bacteroidota bacterium]